MKNLSIDSLFHSFSSSSTSRSVCSNTSLSICSSSFIIIPSRSHFPPSVFFFSILPKKSYISPCSRGIPVKKSKKRDKKTAKGRGFVNSRILNPKVENFQKAEISKAKNSLLAPKTVSLSDLTLRIYALLEKKGTKDEPLSVLWQDSREDENQGRKKTQSGPA